MSAKYYLYIVCMALSALIFYGCDAPEAPEEEDVSYCVSEVMQKKIILYDAEKRPATQSYPLTGKVEYNPDRVLNFVSLVGGVVTNTYFSLGDNVKKGQLLLEIRSTELSGMESERKSLESLLKVAQRNLSSVQSMHEDGIASQKSLLEAESEVEVIAADLEKIKANLALYSASSERGVFQVQASTSGIIVSKNVTPGMQISAEGESLFTIGDLNEVWVILNIYPSNVVNVKEGMKVDIRTLSYPNEVFKGMIARLSQVFDSEERVLKARVVMPNADLKLKPGMLVDVQVQKEVGVEAVVVPTSAIIFDNNQSNVVVFVDSCQLEIRPIEILVKSNGATFLKSGVAEGEQVIVRNQLLIYEQIKNK